MKDMIGKTDMHFHYNPKFSLNKYKENIKGLVDARIIIYNSQVRKDSGEWYNGMLRIARLLDIRCGIEHSITVNAHKLTNLFPFVDVIHSIHTYKGFKDWIYIFENSIDKHNIKYICHPFHKQLCKGIEVPNEILNKFVKLCNNNNITVEFNSRYMRNTYACKSFMWLVKRYVKNTCWASDATVPERIGMYGREMVEK